MVAVPDYIKDHLILRCWARCEICGLPSGLDPHHRRSRGMGGVHGEAQEVSDSYANFLAVCRVCHDRIDADPDYARSRGWLIPRAMPVDAEAVPAYIWTAQGRGWWFVCPPEAPDGFVWLDVLNPAAKRYLLALGLDWAGTAGLNAFLAEPTGESVPVLPRGGSR